MRITRCSSETFLLFKARSFICQLSLLEAGLPHEGVSSPRVAMPPGRPRLASRVRGPARSLSHKPRPCPRFFPLPRRLHPTREQTPVDFRPEPLPAECRRLLCINHVFLLLDTWSLADPAAHAAPRAGHFLETVSDWPWGAHTSHPIQNPHTSQPPLLWGSHTQGHCPLP